MMKMIKMSAFKLELTEYDVCFCQAKRWVNSGLQSTQYNIEHRPFVFFTLDL